MRTALVALFAIASFSVAAAEDRVLSRPMPPPGPAQVGAISPIIYLERCSNGCTIKRGSDDAKAYTSEMPMGNELEFSIGEYRNENGELGAAADTEWNAVVKCVQEVYSPFAVQVTDVKPTSPTYHMTIVAGFDSDIGWDGALGVGFSGCTPQNNRISYTFANAVGKRGQDRIWRMCQIIAQESGHTFALDHAYAFGAESACRDPMSYRGDCGGQKFFRNDQATCGEYTGRVCGCGGLQNAHTTLLTAFGPGTPLTTPPTLTVTQPAPGATIENAASVKLTAAAQRGIKVVELWVNGYKWAETGGAAFGPVGQPEAQYGIVIPAQVPDGVMDLTIKAKDDIDVTTEQTITVTKGAPCASADACLAGQVCEAGKCFWEPAAGVLGDACTYEQFCTTGICAGAKDSDEKFCTRSCVLASTAGCPENFECVEGDQAGKGFCVAATGGGGGCNTGRDDLPYGALMFGLFGVGVVILRRRR